MSNPTSAKFFLGTVNKGRTPITVTGVPTTQPQVSIRISKDGYKDFIGTVPVYPGLTSTVNVTLIRK